MQNRMILQRLKNTGSIIKEGDGQPFPTIQNLYWIAKRKQV